LAKTGLLRSIADAATAIDLGRKGFATRGKEQEGRISYERGIAEALSAILVYIDLIFILVYHKNIFNIYKRFPFGKSFRLLKPIG
jgi:hypothetical protein